MLIITDRLAIDFLQSHYIANYLRNFSAAVQHILNVHSLESEKQYLEHQLWAQEKGYTHFYCLFDRLTEQVMGAIEIRNPIQHPGQLYCWLHENYWSKGLLGEGMVPVAHDYFARSENSFFNAHVHHENKRSYHALKKCGFADEGMYDGPWGLQHVLRYGE